MKKVMLGNTGLEVSRLCFGTLPMGPLQKGLSVAEGAPLIRYALEQGITFVDTATSYRTYDYIAEAVKGYSGELTIATKTHATTYEEADKHVQLALATLGCEAVDVFHLHAARRLAPFDEMAGALECLLSYQRRGFIRAVGISTHVVGVVREAARHPEIGVIFALVNRSGMGVLGGSRDEMVAAIGEAHRAGKGLYAMKIFAGGNLLDDRPGAFDFANQIDGMDAISVGMVKREEVDYNLALFHGLPIDAHLTAATAAAKKRLVVLQNLCRGCGDCVEACQTGALRLTDGKSAVAEAECILCGYCSPVCSEFAIRMV